MRFFSRTHDSDTEGQAALWAARLDGGILSAEARLQLDSWLAANPSHRTLLSAYCQFSADLEQQMPLLEGIRDGSVDARPQEQTARPRPWLLRPIWGGAMLTAAAAVVLVLWLSRPSPRAEDIATPMAQRSSRVLADGSKLEINAQTNLHISLSQRERHIRLAAGEAFFTVSKDITRPFIVETPAGSVRVTGTHFNVRAESPEALEVIVEEGSVQVRPSGAAGAAPVTLRAGDCLTARPTGVAIKSLDPAALRDALAWRQGQVVFAGTPLRDALARYARYHGRGFTISPAAGELRVGGRYSIEDFDGFLSAAEETWPELRITRDLGGNIQIGLRAER